MIKDQTILLLHGANSVGNEWVNFENEFKKLGNKVVKPILRHHRLGFNGSEKLGNTSIFDYVADIEETIKKLKQQGADIIDIGRESTRPNSNTVNSLIEWRRI